MGEVAAFDYLVEQCEIKRLQKTLIKLGRRRFGHADDASEAVLLSIVDLDRLERLEEAGFMVNNWQELINMP